MTLALFELLREITEQYEEGIINEAYKRGQVQPILDALIKTELQPLLEEKQLLTGERLGAHHPHFLQP